jgi:hypothetical protein
MYTTDSKESKAKSIIASPSIFNKDIQDDALLAKQIIFS